MCVCASACSGIDGKTLASFFFFFFFKSRLVKVKLLREKAILFNAFHFSDLGSWINKLFATTKQGVLLQNIYHIVTRCK